MKPAGRAAPARRSRLGRWVGMSYDGLVVSGWDAIARTQELAAQVVQDHIDQDAKEAVP